MDPGAAERIALGRFLDDVENTAGFVKDIVEIVAAEVDFAGPEASSVVVVVAFALAESCCWVEIEIAVGVLVEGIDSVGFDSTVFAVVEAFVVETYKIVAAIVGIEVVVGCIAVVAVMWG